MKAKNVSNLQRYEREKALEEEPFKNK